MKDEELSKDLSAFQEDYNELIDKWRDKTTPTRFIILSMLSTLTLMHDSMKEDNLEKFRKLAVDMVDNLMPIFEVKDDE